MGFFGQAKKPTKNITIIIEYNPSAERESKIELVEAKKRPSREAEYMEAARQGNANAGHEHDYVSQQDAMERAAQQRAQDRVDEYNRQQEVAQDYRIGASEGNAGIITPPKQQIPNDPNNWHCDINSFNRAEQNGLDGGSWDGNSLTVNDIVDQYYSDQIQDLPPANSAGYGARQDGNGGYEHFYYYEYDGGSKIDIWDSDGKQDQTHKEKEMNDDYYVKEFDFIPLSPRK